MTDPDSLPAVCVVTHPLEKAGENATRSLLDILSGITSVHLLTVGLPDSSEIRDRFGYTEMAPEGAGEGILTMIARFLLNQLRMCHHILTREERVFLFFGATAYLLPIVLARLMGYTVIVEPRGDVPLSLRLRWEESSPPIVARGLAAPVRVAERLGFGVADGIITYTPSMARQLGIDPESDGVHATGARYVRTDQFDIDAEWDTRPLRVGFVGRFEPEKGISKLAAVAHQLAETGVSFEFVGQGSLDGWLRDHLAAEIETGAVSVRDWVAHDEMPRTLNGLRLLVMASSPTEGLPTTILESMACGTPVYAPAVSGIPDVVTPGETGYLMDTIETSEVARQVSAAVQDGSEGPVLSERCRSLIEEEFSLEAAQDRYRSILWSVLS